MFGVLPQVMRHFSRVITHEQQYACLVFYEADTKPKLWILTLKPPILEHPKKLIVVLALNLRFKPHFFFVAFPVAVLVLKFVEKIPHLQSV